MLSIFISSLSADRKRAKPLSPNHPSLRFNPNSTGLTFYESYIYGSTQRFSTSLKGWKEQSVRTHFRLAGLCEAITDHFRSSGQGSVAPTYVLPNGVEFYLLPCRDIYSPSPLYMITHLCSFRINICHHDYPVGGPRLYNRPVCFTSLDFCSGSFVLLMLQRY